MSSFGLASLLRRLSTTLLGALAVLALAGVGIAVIMRTQVAGITATTLPWKQSADHVRTSLLQLTPSVKPASREPRRPWPSAAWTWRARAPSKALRSA